MGRLMETKFHDNALYYAKRLTDKDADRLLDFTGDALWATLPDPMLKAMEIDVDKKSVAYSMGDYISYLGGAGDVGGFRTGSGLAQGLALGGYAFPIIYLLICPILFLAQDLLSFRSREGEVWISALGMLGIWRMFQYGITAESLEGMFMSVARGLPQNIILYLLVFHFSRWAAFSLGTLAGQGPLPTVRKTAA